MEYEMNLREKLGDELVELWSECSIRCERIEELLKQIKETDNNIK